MIAWAGVPGPTTDALPEGNPADLLYLEEAVAALSQIMAVCAGADRSSRTDVRALARAALSVQTDRFTAVSTVLHGWGRPDGSGPASTGVDALDGLDGEALDRAFVEALTAYTHASTVRSRAELVAGASRATRNLAEHAIHEDDRQLADLRDFLRIQGQQIGAPGVHDPVARWNDDGGSWPGASAATPSDRTGARRWPT
ncbi:hypothetical protein NYO98_09740 [Nocardioides sp. STR2]|uniref:DUF4439 domain-containing protein n=1 Tax=Nocardioides pini TaxID=2975053 RepID=A0ABT4CC73_9ACTN|nr:hypothetical protein [Nocardioides pini]MCY4726557.1 hypothetical protein [Nocardioides pini]